MNFKKFFTGSLAALAGLSLLTTPLVNAQEKTQVDELKVQFVPSRDPQEILTETEPLADLLTQELANLGYEVGKVDISVGTNYEATGEALAAGTVDIGFIPGGTYVLYDDGAEVILTATRDGLSIDSEDPKEWNENKPTEQTEDQVTYYRGLILAGPSEKGRELADKINKGEQLTWDDINSANWSVMGTSSPAGYIYPSLWMRENFDGKTLSDLQKAVQSDSYASAFARLASGQVDVLVTFADARIDYADQWQGEFGGKNDIWTDVDVIGVTKGMMNDTISVSKNSKTLTPELVEAIQQAMINIGNTPEGKEVIDVYTHKGYVEANPEDYDVEREAQKLLREMN
ncbi:phosphate/phosphite/phosphonate ABC transporter substrate-binding protein [Hutsoniella sourekii]|uniref:phosphate/phosphite/phosphonate ABC transporter substrate-binding protein n=1 Tax=Hutsoniella sourekii TaxID=87650 RepID=UPI000482382C|nr:PhnD/SsuA/transferrin family substrate-binding protein [Hutsoniella sourekii]